MLFNGDIRKLSCIDKQLLKAKERKEQSVSWLEAQRGLGRPSGFPSKDRAQMVNTRLFRTGESTAKVHKGLAIKR